MMSLLEQGTASGACPEWGAFSWMDQTICGFRKQLESRAATVQSGEGAVAVVVMKRH